jgi:putative endonuclease
MAAEEIVNRHYVDQGHLCEAKRYRKASGEIDLIFRKGPDLIFVEVKKSKSHARAAQALSQKQLTRIFAAATEFLATQPLGQDTPVRFDVALVDGAGRVECLENVMMS